MSVHVDAPRLMKYEHSLKVADRIYAEYGSSASLEIARLTDFEYPILHITYGVSVWGYRSYVHGWGKCWYLCYFGSSGGPGGSMSRFAYLLDLLPHPLPFAFERNGVDKVIPYERIRRYVVAK